MNQPSSGQLDSHPQAAQQQQIANHLKHLLSHSFDNNSSLGMGGGTVGVGGNTSSINNH